MTALPRFFYGDPSECVDVIRKVREASTRKAERERINKSRRIRALVKQAMKGVKR